MLLEGRYQKSSKVALGTVVINVTYLTSRNDFMPLSLGLAISTVLPIFVAKSLLSPVWWLFFSKNLKPFDSFWFLHEETQRFRYR